MASDVFFVISGFVVAVTRQLTAPSFCCAGLFRVQISSGAVHAAPGRREGRTAIILGRTPPYIYSPV